jgi:hypothetical protein
VQTFGRPGLRDHVSHGDDTVTTGSDDRESQVPSRHYFLPISGTLPVLRVFTRFVRL